MLRRFLNWIGMPEQFDQKWAVNRQWFTMMIIVTLVAVWLYTIYAWVSNRLDIYLMFSGGYTVISIVVLFLLRANRLHTAAVFFSFSNLIGMLYAAYEFGGVHSSSYFAILIALLIIAMLLPGRITLLATSLSIAFGGLLIFGEYQGWYHPELKFQGTLDIWIGTSVVFALGTALIGFASKTIKTSFHTRSVEEQERRNAESRLREQAQYLRALHETTLSIINRLELLPLLESILNHACELVKTEHGYIDMQMPGSSNLVQVMGHGVMKVLNGAIVQPGIGVGGKALETGKIQVIAEYQTWSGRISEYSDIGFKAVTAVPMKLRNEVIGIIGVAYVEPGRHFSETQIEWLEQFAELASLALDNARLYQAAQAELNQHERTQAALFRSEEILRLALNAALMGTWDLDVSTNQWTWSEAAYDIFGLSKELSPRIEALVPAIIHPEDKEKASQSIQQSLENPQIAHEVEYRVNRPDGKLIWIESKGSVYVDKNGAPIRMAGTITDITDRKQAEQALLEANQHLEKNSAIIERRSTMLQVAAEVSRAASAILDPDVLSQQVVELVQKRFGLYYVGLFLVDEPGEFAVLRAATGEAGREMLRMGHKLTIGNTSMVGWCIVNRKPRLALDADEDAVRFSNPLLPETRSELALPLLSRGEVLGALTIQSQTEGAFSTESIATFQTMTDQLANALLNARLYDQLGKELEERKNAEEEVRKLNEELEERVRQRTADLKASEETFRALTENNPLRIRRYDRDGRYLYANPVSFGPDVNPDNIIGKTVREVIIDSELADLAERCITQVFETGKPMNTEYKFGNSFASWWLAPEFGPDGKVISVVTSTMDITERRQMEDELRQRTQELQSTNKELEAFSYSVSHDLRAPLRAMDGFSRILLDDFKETVPEEAQHFLNRIREASRQMNQLIDDMLRLSRITRAEMHSNPINLTAMAVSIAYDLRYRDPERKMEVDIQDNLSAAGDEGLLRVALENLMSNAWKFSAKNPQARIEVGKTQSQGKEAFFVRDNGVGFDMDYADKLFGTFQRLHNAEEFPGTGIGLAIVQRVIHKHGGQVWAESEPGQGATFYFTLQK